MKVREAYVSRVYVCIHIYIYIYVCVVSRSPGRGARAIDDDRAMIRGRSRVHSRWVIRGGSFAGDDARASESERDVTT